MGWMTNLFGGTEVQDTGSPEIYDIANRLANFDPGLGKAGKMAKGYLKLAQKGRMTELPSVQLAIAQGQRGWQDLQRNLQMGTAMMPGEQSGLYAGILAKSQLQSQNNIGLQAMQGAASDISNFSNIFNLAKSNRTNAQLQGLQSAGQLRSQNRQMVQKQGILGGLSGIFGSLIPGIGGLAGLGRRGGGNRNLGWNPQANGAIPGLDYS